MATYPEIGSRGTLEVAEAYQVIFSSRVIYECIAIESLSGLLNAGVFPYDLYYLPYRIDIGLYKEDLALDSPIISFKTSDGRVFKIPARFITSLPQADGVVYQSLAFGVALNIIEEGMDVEPLVGEIKQLVLTRTGISCDIQTVVTGPDVLLTHDQHRAVRVSRRDAATHKPTFLLMYTEEHKKHLALKTYCDRLELTLEAKEAEVRRLQALLDET